MRSSSLSSFIGRSPIQQKQLLLNIGGKNPSEPFQDVQLDWTYAQEPWTTVRDVHRDGLLSDQGLFF